MVHHLFHQIPSFRLLLAYLAGVLLFSQDNRFVLCFLLLTVWIWVSYCLLKKRLPSAWTVRWMPGVAMAFIWSCIGSMAGQVAWHQSAFPVQSGEKTSIEASACLLEDPVEKKKTYQLYVHIYNDCPKIWKWKKLVLYLPKEEQSASLTCGDRIHFRARPAPPENRLVTARFDYVRWLRMKGFCGTAFVKKPDWHYEDPPSWWQLRAMANRIRMALIAVFRRAGLSESSLGLVSAMSLGTRDTLNPVLRRDFSAAGITHILSVSGLHVAVVYALLKGLLFFLGFSDESKKVRELIVVLLLWGYAFVTGLSPSVNRSVLMFSLLAVGTCLGKQSQSLNTVLFSAFLLLLINPLYIYDIGFQLSYGAVLGIVVIYPLVKAMWKPRIRLLTYLWEMMSLSLVAQLVTAPLTIHYFGQFPNYFLPANLVAVPLSGLLIYLAAGCLIASPVPGLFSVMAWSLSQCTAIFLVFAQGISRLPWAVSDGLVLHTDQVVLVYGLMVVFSGCFFFKKRWLVGLLAGLLCFQISCLMHQIMSHI